MKRIRQKIKALLSKPRHGKKNPRSLVKRAIKVFQRLKGFRKAAFEGFVEREKRVLQMRELSMEGKLGFHEFKDYLAEMVLLKRSIENSLRFLKGSEKNVMKKKLVSVKDSIKKAQIDLLQARKKLVDIHYEHLFDYFFHPQRIDFEEQFDGIHETRYLKIDLEKVGEDLMKIVREVDFAAAEEIVERLIKASANLSFIQREPGAKAHLEFGLRNELHRIKSNAIALS